MSKVSAKKQPVNTRELVLSCSLKLFTKDGYFNTSVHDIARESGVSIGSIYHHFKDKEGLAGILYHSLLTRMSDELISVSQSHTSAQDRCRAVIEVLFDITEREPDVMEFMLYAKHREFLPDETPICSSQPFELMREMVRQGMENGEIREMDVMVASTCLFGGAIRMITSRLDGLVPGKLSGYQDEIWNCSWRAVSA